MLWLLNFYKIPSRLLGACSLTTIFMHGLFFSINELHCFEQEKWCTRVASVLCFAWYSMQLYMYVAVLFLIKTHFSMKVVFFFSCLYLLFPTAMLSLEGCLY